MHLPVAGNQSGQTHGPRSDIGDNNARRKDVTLYIVEEPDPVM